MRWMSLAAIVLPLLGARAHAAPAVVPLGDNERVVHVVGTPFHHTYYNHPLETHLLLRYAHRGLIFRRVTISREHLESFSARTDQAILAHKPTLVVIQAGFDDLICRAQSAYAPKLNFAWYPKGLETIVSKLRAANARVVVCSVHPWDNGSTRDNLIFPMDGMKGMVQAAREIAARHQAYFADLFTDAIGWPGIGDGPQRKYLYASQEHEKSWQLLHSQIAFDFPGSTAQVDAKSLRAEAAGATVEQIRPHEGGIAFILRNAAGAGPAVVKVTGLPAGRYAVAAGQTKAATATAEELAAGIDLGAHLKTKAGSKEFLDELSRGHAAVDALPAIQNYRLPDWTNLPDFEQQKAAAVQKALDAVAAHDAAVRAMVVPEPLNIRVHSVR